jgi:hypothetical protein
MNYHIPTAVGGMTVQHRFLSGVTLTAQRDRECGRSQPAPSHEIHVELRNAVIGKCRVIDYYYLHSACRAIAYAEGITSL